MRTEDMTRAGVDAWTLTALAREATRNVFVRHSRLFALVIVAMVAGIGSSLFMAYESNALREQLATLDAQGRNVISFAAAPSASGPSQISRRSCENLSVARGVVRAGLLESGPRTPVVQLGQPVSTVRASTTLFPALLEHEALIGSVLLRPQRDSLIETGLGTLDAYPATVQPTGVGTNSSLVLPLSPSAIAGAQCVVVLKPSAAASEQIPILAAQLVVSGQPVAGKQATAQSVDPIALYLSRTSRYLPLLLGLACALAAALRNYLRAGEFAAYRLSGTSARSLGMIIFFEQAIVAGTGLVSGTAVLLTVHNYVISSRGSFAWLSAGFTLWVAVACIASLPVVLRGAVAMSKDR